MRNIKILLADPHRKRSRWIQDVSSQSDMTFQIVGSGEEAMEQFREYTFDAVIINAKLPDISGPQLATLIKKLDQQISAFVVSQEVPVSLWKETVRAKAVLLPLPLDVKKLRSIISPLDASKKEREEKNHEGDYEDTKSADDALENDQTEPLEQDTVTTVPLDQPETADRPSRSRNCEIVLCYSWKGGVGKTTTAVNLAAAVKTYTSQSVGVIELTRQTGNMLSHFALTPAVTVRDWMTEQPDQSLARSRMLEDPATGLYILPTQTLLDESERAIKVNPAEARRMIDVLSEAFDVLVIDGGTLLDEVLYVLLDTADHVLLISDMNTETLQENHYMPEIMRRKGIDTRKLVHVLNRAEKGLGLTEKEALSMVEAPVQHVIHAHKKVQYNQKEREPFIVSHAKHAYTSEVCQLASVLFPNQEELQRETGWWKKVIDKVSQG